MTSSNFSAAGLQDVSASFFSMAYDKFTVENCRFQGGGRDSRASAFREVASDASFALSCSLIGGAHHTTVAITNSHWKSCLAGATSLRIPWSSTPAAVHVKYTGCTFTDNTDELARVSLGGAAIQAFLCEPDHYNAQGNSPFYPHATQYGELFVHYCEFNNNTTPRQGGAVYATNGFMDFLHNVMNNNVAAYRGGAMALFGKAEATLSHCRLSGNRALETLGSDLYIDVEDVRFVNTSVVAAPANAQSNKAIVVRGVGVVAFVGTSEWVCPAGHVLRALSTTSANLGLATYQQKDQLVSLRAFVFFVTCVRCSLGEYSVGAVSAVNAASQGTYGLCRRCEPGQFNDNNIELGCQNCSAGSISAVAGATQCSTCQAGYFALEGSSVCSSCAPGKFKGNSGAGLCSDCAVGFATSEFASVSCTACASEGAISNANLTVCEKCPPGRSLADVNRCEACPAGRSAPLYGSRQCDDCVLNTYTASPGATACVRYHTHATQGWEGRGTSIP